VVIGVFPGLGPASGILILYPVLAGLPVIDLFVFYAVMMSSVQYYGSIPSIVYGVAGEITSAPAVHYGHAEFKQGRGAELLSGTATSSLIASLVGVTIFTVSTYYIEFLKYFINNTPRLLMLAMIMTLISVASPKKLLALLFAILGLLIGHIGYDQLRNEHFLSSSSFLASGIPFVPVFIGFLMLPEIFLYAKNQPCVTSIDLRHFDLKRRISHLLKFPSITASMRGSVLGSILGLVPMVGTSISSMVAAALEKKINSDNQKIVISAEAANNSASITVLIPLIFLALPVIPSEGVIMAMAERNGFGMSNSFDVLSKISTMLLVILLLINFVNWIVAGVFYRGMVSIYLRLYKVIYPIMIALSVIVCVYDGVINNQLLLYVLTALISLLIGFWISEFSVRVALVFGMLLSASVSSELFRFILLNF